ncbi:hypothetical protein RSOLAG1IB_04346 [Rhizoctonia solani AG-1 IB]|uniref:WD40 domain-containing protein n=1 Tax=Thanatephorus cucumeris (strain AG1-IB / isolate 7/3/14) TaxID=1108050 RepID=A0A0B7FUJ5_THACB|nr:hypothetical protein RSOLAG1IB_04346 [Rhizoctonia solani AG-1 IB]
MFAQGAQKFITEVHYPRRIINVWDTENGARVAGPFELGELFDFSPNGTHIVCRSLENPVVGDLQIMSADSGEILSAVSTPDNQYIVSAKFTSDGLSLAYNTYTAYYLWDICNHTSRTVAIRPKWTSTAPSFACSQDGWCLASGKKDKPRLEAESDLRIWGFRIDNPLCAALQPDGWALDSGSRKLFWIPTPIKDAFLKGSGLFIEYNGSGYDSDHTLCVDFNDIIFGDKWSRCYIGG